jgi:Uma2 family endonuclease
MTTLEYFETPESLLPTELAFGTLRVRDAPSSAHQTAVGAFYRALYGFVRRSGLGDVWIAPLDVVLDEARGLVVQPDLLFVSRDRAGIVQRRVYGPPDLVVEVLSPKPRVGDLDQRLGWFATYGVRECWVCHQTAGALEVITFGDGAIDRRALIGQDEAIPTGCLPGFPLTLRQILSR